MMPHINDLAKNKDKFWKDLEKQTILILAGFSFSILILSIIIWIL